jgi:hypothetical protein
MNHKQRRKSFFHEKQAHSATRATVTGNRKLRGVAHLNFNSVNVLSEQDLHSQRHRSDSPNDVQQSAKVEAADEERSTAGQADGAVRRLQDEGQVHG